MKAAGVDPLAHFLQFGAQEGAAAGRVRPSCSPERLRLRLLSAEQSGRRGGAASIRSSTSRQFGWKEGRNPNALFDTTGYLATYTDVEAAGVNPLDHYNSSAGTKAAILGRFRHDLVSAANPDVKAANVDPLLHYLQFGIHEGRSPFADGVWG